ncbi:MBL fold metallo-hydrolase [Ideonella sp. YS5]|uniref:MBL fold metallo-hydrolase n=1 Tax=Ideonella sp. YS5 TaxID=3453714 RepID=UPI003EEFF043
MPHRHGALAALAVTVALNVGCSSVNPYYDPSKPHHRPDGFNNHYVDNWSDRPSFWRWQWERWTGDLPAQDVSRVPRTQPDLAYLRANRRDATVTWLGHSTALWQIGGLNILTDPQFSERASPVSFMGPKREVPLPARLEELPRIDAVLISHNHYDHLDLPTVQALAAQAAGPPLFLVPLGIDLWLRDQGIPNSRAIDWWDRVDLPVTGGSVSVHLVPVQHWTSRTPWDRNRVLWGGFVVQGQVGARPYSMFYTGDTGYSKDFQDIGARFGGFDFSQIAVGCYQPRWFMKMQHVDEDEAVRIHLDVKSRRSIGVHWGTFRLCDDPVEAPLEGLPKARALHGVPDDAFTLLAIGQTLVLERAK